MIDRRKQLEQLTTNQLMDAVKNYRQYGYDDDVRDCAIAILEERGVSEQSLAMSGNLTNDTYDTAVKLYNSFKRNSIIALISLCALPIVTILEFVYDSHLLFVVALLLFCAYFIFFVNSFISKYRFDKTIDKNDELLGTILVYFFIGTVFFFIIYFYYKSQMKEQIKYLQ